MGNPNLVRFVLTGAKKGKTIGLQRRSDGTFSYNFVDGVMEVHASKVNGRLITHLRNTYSAVVEGSEDGVSNVQADGDESLGSEAVHNDGLAKAKPSAAAESAIKLKGSAKPKAGSKK